MKLHLYITDTAAYLEGNFSSCFQVSTWDDWADHEGSSWVHAGEIEFDISNISIDEMEVRQSAIDALDKAETKERAEHQVKMNMLKVKREKLLAIEHKS